MGRLIDIDEARKEYSNLMDLTMSDTTLLQTLYGVLDNAPTVEAIPKADYENRLKADMVAMLEEMLLETEEMDCEIDHDFEGYYNGVVACQKCIQQKINSLKENKGG